MLEATPEHNDQLLPVPDDHFNTQAAGDARYHQQVTIIVEQTIGEAVEREEA